jgi:hypothetical protein
LARVSNHGSLAPSFETRSETTAPQDEGELVRMDKSVMAGLVPAIHDGR